MFEQLLYRPFPVTEEAIKGGDGGLGVFSA